MRPTGIESCACSRVVRGRMRFVAECQPRFDYGRSGHKVEILADGVAFHADDGSEVALHIARRPGVAPADAVQPAVRGRRRPRA